MQDTYEIILEFFFIINKANQVKFFEETFLIANDSPKIVFKILFLTLSIVDNDFLD